MKWNAYQPITFLPLAMILLYSCQSKVQEDNTAYERFKQKKLKEKDSTFVQKATTETLDTIVTVTSTQKVNTVTAMAKVSRTASGTASDAMNEYEQSSAESPKVQKTIVIKESTVSEDNSHKKGLKQKKHIEWPKINKINLKKKKKQKGSEEVG